MKAVREEMRGEAILRIIPRGKCYAGAVIAKGKTGAVIEGDDADELWARLEAEAARAEPSYFGYSGARARFLRVFPGGFADPTADRERGYKMKAKERLDAIVDVGTALTGTGYGPALRPIFGLNLLSPFESPRIGEVLASPAADSFVRGAAMLAEGHVEHGLRAMEAALKPFNVATWPAATLLPFLWRPDRHMFLKPEATQEFAKRVGHPFAYQSGLKASVYNSLLSLAEATSREIADVGARDMIDTQSFIWVVGKYTEDDIATVRGEAERLKAAGAKEQVRT